MILTTNFLDGISCVLGIRILNNKQPAMNKIKSTKFDTGPKNLE